jgi:pyruvate dehydrogenase E1 component alpha subunit
VLAVRGAAGAVYKWVREGNGPVLMELKTYRYRGHSMSDPAKYRSRDEVQSMRDHNDPIERLKKELEAAGTSDEALKSIDKEIRAIVAEAADFAEQSPEPELSELHTDVLVGKY